MRLVTRNNNNRRNQFPRLRKTTPNHKKSCTSATTPNPHPSSASNPDENTSDALARSTDVKFELQLVPYSHFVEFKPNSVPALSSCAQPKTETEPGKKSPLKDKVQKILRFRKTKVGPKIKKIKLKSKDQNLSQSQEKTEEDDLTLDVNFRDLKYNLWASKFLTLVKIVPTDLEMDLGLFQVNKNKPKIFKYLDKFLFSFWQFYAILRIFNLILVTIPYIFLLKKSISQLQLFRNFFTILVTGVCIGLYFGYIQITVFDMTSPSSLLTSLLQNVRKKQNESTNANSGWNPKVRIRIRIEKMFKSILQRSTRANLLIYLPFFTYSLIFLIPGLLFLDPNIPIFWTCFSLGSNFTGIPRFFCPLLIILDLIFYFFVLSHVYIAVLAMLLFMILNEQEVDDAIQILRSRGGLEKAGKILQKFKLEILLFNRVFSPIVYLTKKLGLAAAIIGGFLSIKFFPSEPLLVLMTAFLYLQSTTTYFVLFDKVDLITDKVEELKLNILEKAGHPKQKVKTIDEYKRICRSVQSLGISAGGFYRMDRKNILIFMDFVVTQVAGLLLTFH